MIRQWEIDALAIRQEIRVDVLDAEQYDPGFPPSRLPDFLEWLDGILKQIPEDCRETAQIEFSSTGSYYDSHYGNVEVTYRRPETDQEWADRKQRVTAAAREQIAEQERAERRALEVLKKKYEPEQK